MHDPQGAVLPLSGIVKLTCARRGCGESSPTFITGTSRGYGQSAWRTRCVPLLHTYARPSEHGSTRQLNTRFYHLAYFVLSFDLLKPGELRPLRSLILMRLPEHLTSSIVW